MQAIARKLMKTQGSTWKRKETEFIASKRRETQGNARKRKETQGSTRKIVVLFLQILYEIRFI